MLTVYLDVVWASESESYTVMASLAKSLAAGLIMMGNPMHANVFSSDFKDIGMDFRSCIVAI